MLFSNIDFNFDDFDHFHFAHFEIEENFGLIWVKLQNGSLANFHFRYLKGAPFRYGLYFCSFCVLYTGSFEQIWGKITKNDPLDLKMSILVLVSQIMVFHFVHF